MIASFILYSIMFGFSIGLTALSLVIERKEGLMDRTWVAGVNVNEIIIAQVITQFFVLLVQITLLVTVIVFGFKVSYHTGKNVNFDADWSNWFSNLVCTGLFGT